MQITQRIFEILLNPINKRSQTEFASHLGISGKTVGAWKTRNSDPPAKYIPAIADFLGVSIEWLLTGDERNKNGSVHVTGSVSGGAVVQGSNNGYVTVSNGNERVLSDEESELLRVYGALDVKGRINLLKTAFELEESKKQSD